MNNRQIYIKPHLFHLGHITELTFGRGGSSPDGGGSLNQTGGGNDGGRSLGNRNALPPRSPRTPDTP